MDNLPTPNPALARKIWDSMARPSTRRVATKLRQAGIPVSHLSRTSPSGEAYKVGFSG
jgi:hypothetical protein